MRVLFFTNTPAHVHLYKHAVRELLDRGHDVLVLGREDGCARDLLEYYDLPYRIYGKRGTTPRDLLAQLPRHYAKIFRLVRSFDPDRIFGMGGYAAPAGLVSDTSVIAIQDSEPHTLDYLMSRPIVDAFLTPYTFGRDLGPKQYRFLGFKETAYLHPDSYEPTTDIRSELGLPDDEPYVLLRFNSWGAYHDVGQSGFDADQRVALVRRLSEEASVVVSAEDGVASALPETATVYDGHPAHMHDAIAEASLLVADTQTMVTEAALLGTPAIRSNSFVGEDDMGNFTALEAAGLIHNVVEFDELLELATEFLVDGERRDSWQRQHAEFVEGLVDLTDLIVDVATVDDPVAALDAKPTQPLTAVE